MTVSGGFYWLGPGDLNARPPAPKADFVQGANYAGTMRCSEAIGTRIQLAGTWKNLGR
jgi:hypothetical protein